MPGIRMAATSLLSLALLANPAMAQKKYDPGASDSEIKLGQTNPFSGPASAYATIGKTQAAYMKMINDQGGVNGRKIVLKTLDDGYEPPRAVENTKKFINDEKVFALFGYVGTPTSAASTCGPRARRLANSSPRPTKPCSRTTPRR